jgi:hypothetical protein
MAKKKAKDEGIIDHLLRLEEPVRAEADRVPSGPNSDALKSGLLSAAHGIAHVRKALDQIRRLER